MKEGPRPWGLPSGQYDHGTLVSILSLQKQKRIPVTTFVGLRFGEHCQEEAERFAREKEAASAMEQREVTSHGVRLGLEIWGQWKLASPV